jgi:hypothetical protein
MAKQKTVSYRVSSDVEIPIFHPQVIAAIGIILNGKGWNFRYIQNLQSVDFYLDLSGGTI